MQTSCLSSLAQGALDDVARYWNGGCPFKTRVVDVVSASVPGAERLIIQIVREMVHRSDDHTLRARGQMLIRHEALHMKLHDRLNDRLRAQGLPIDELEAAVKLEVVRVLAYRDHQWQMGYAAALEYLGSMVSACLIAGRVNTIRGADPKMLALYLEHAADEVEHAHVVPSFARSSGVGYLRRVLPMMHITVKSVFLTMWFTNHMLARDGLPRHRRWPLLVAGWCWLSFGTILPLIPHYLKFYSRSFEPVVP
jgi:uncharacterized protein